MLRQCSQEGAESLRSKFAIGQVDMNQALLELRNNTSKSSDSFVLFDCESAQYNILSYIDRILRQIECGNIEIGVELHGIGDG